MPLRPIDPDNTESIEVNTVGDVSNPVGESKITSETIGRLKQVLKRNPNVQFILCPTPQLQQMIVNATHPIVNNLPKGVQTLFLENKGLRVERAMVIRWLEGKLDVNNTFIFNFGDIRVEGSSEVVIGNFVKENEDGK